MMSCVHCRILIETACRVSPSVMPLLGDVASQGTIGDHRCLRSEAELIELSLAKDWETMEYIYTFRCRYNGAAQTVGLVIGHPNFVQIDES